MFANCVPVEESPRGDVAVRQQVARGAEPGARGARGFRGAVEGAGLQERVPCVSGTWDTRLKMYVSRAEWTFRRKFTYLPGFFLLKNT